MEAIKEVYEEAKSRGYDFEIVQITFHYHPFNAQHRDTDPTVQQCCEDVSWLTLPFKDPSCRKVQRILHCDEEADENWVGDSLVLIHPHQAEASGVPFDLSGAKILQRWGIEGYLFTRPSLYKAEYERQKREATIQSLFPLRERLLRSVGDGFDHVDVVSQLSGKRVLVLFAMHSGGHYVCPYGDNFVSMLKSVYHVQLEDNIEEESKFEVVCVSTGGKDSSFKEFTKEMPWLVRPLTSQADWGLLPKIFKGNISHACVAAFNEQGDLIAKAAHLAVKTEGYRL